MGDRRRPNNGPPMHRHSREDEAFYVLEGEFSFPYGNSKIKASKGEFAYVPRGEFHTYKNKVLQASYW